MAREKRIAENPLAHLSAGNVKVDRRHDRQTLAPDQLSLILETAQGSGRSFRGLAGSHRQVLYLLAMTTGFRASELASLTPTAFDLDADPATATAASAYTKNRQPATQPLSAEAVDVLRSYLEGKSAHALLWPGTWAEDGATMLRIDLEAAGIPYVIDGPDGPLYADFHALRHSYVALRGNAEASDATGPAQRPETHRRPLWPCSAERPRSCSGAAAGPFADDQPTTRNAGGNGHRGCQTNARRLGVLLGAF